MRIVEIIKYSILVLFVLIEPLKAFSYVFKVDDLYYYQETDTTVAVTAAQSVDVYYGDIVIPASITYEGVTYTVTAIDCDAFSNCKYVKSVKLPSTINTIKQFAFYRCSGITDIAIPSSVVSIGRCAFQNSGLTRVDIMDLAAWCKVLFDGALANPLYGREHVFVNDQEIHSLTIPDNVTSISDYAFYNFEGLYNVIIPNSVTKIGPRAFALCDNLSNVYSLAIIPPTCNENPFDYSCPLHVPAASVAAYRSAPYWKNFSNIIGDADAIMPDEIIINEGCIKLNVGEKYDKLEAVLSPAGSYPGDIIWESTDPSIATVNNGIVLAKSEGECDIIAQCLYKRDTCHVIVSDISVIISLDQQSARIQPNQSLILTPSASPAMPDLTVYSSDRTVATVKLIDDKIQVTGVHEGTAIITVGSVDGYAIPADCIVEVCKVSGDVNLDNEVNIADVNSVIDFILSGQNNVLGDVNEDEEINIADINVIIDLILGGSTGGSDSGSLNNFEYVDLGLSVKWATCNVGAESCSDIGSFFAWGEIQPKAQYDWTTYKFSSSGTTNMTKYCLSSLGVVKDGKYILEESDDAATKYMGIGWRIPTAEEMLELIENCTWIWYDNYNGTGRSGYLVISNIEGYTNHSIFLPASGYWGGSIYADSNKSGSYWTSSLDYDSYASLKAVQLYFNNGIHAVPSYDRFLGMTIRAVTGKRAPKNIPLFIDDIACQTTSSDFIFTVRLLAGALIDFGWEFSFDEDFEETINARSIPSATIDYYNNILRLIMPKSYIYEHDLIDAYIRAYATNSEGTAYK